MRRDRKIRRFERLEHHIKKTGGMRKALKELRETGKEWIAKIKNNNKTITKRREIYKAATSFYSELYSSNAQEIVKAIKSQKTDKAPGPDKISNDLFSEISLTKS